MQDQHFLYALLVAFMLFTRMQTQVMMVIVGTTQNALVQFVAESAQIAAAQLQESEDLEDGITWSFLLLIARAGLVDESLWQTTDNRYWIKHRSSHFYDTIAKGWRDDDFKQVCEVLLFCFCTCFMALTGTFCIRPGPFMILCTGSECSCQRWQGKPRQCQDRPCRATHCHALSYPIWPRRALYCPNLTGPVMPCLAPQSQWSASHRTLSCTTLIVHDFHACAPAHAHAFVHVYVYACTRLCICVCPSLGLCQDPAMPMHCPGLHSESMTAACLA